MRWFKGIFLLIITNLLVFFTLVISGNILIHLVLPSFGIDLRGSVATHDFAWALVFGFGGAFISLWLSKFFARRGMRMQQVVKPSTPKERLVFDTIRQLAEREGIKMPEVWVYWDDVPNAFATGPTRNSAMVAVSSGLVQNLSDEEVRAVLAHELGHVANGDMLAITLLQGLMNTFVYFLARMISRPVMERNRFAGFMVYMALQFILSVLAMIPICWFSRRREFRADAYAASATGATPMIRALTRIDALAQQTLAARHRGEGMNEDALAMLKIHGQSGGIGHLFATHPPVETRIAALRSLPGNAE